jgi:RNA polymerase-interacting CarD/CdnL/TRCF family regulator
MTYQIGDMVIHLTHGPGKIIAYDEKSLAGQTHRYYVIETGQLTVWVLFGEMGEKSIRPPTGSFEFKRLLNILHSAGESLPDHYLERKTKLDEWMQQRILVNLCFVIRDLTNRSKFHNLNTGERSMLRRAEEYLLDEWELSLGTERSRARKELVVLLRVDQSME